MKEHKKHVNLTRPQMGEWGRNEYAIIGTTCDAIESLVNTLSEKLSQDYKVGYIDASHNEQTSEVSFHQKTTHHKTHIEVEKIIEDNVYQQRLRYNDADLILVNGNHFTATKQIVVIDERKRESLSRKLDRLTNVDLVILQDQDLEIYPFLTELVSDDVPVYSIHDTDKIIHHLISEQNKSLKVNGLILAGGKSQRMGYDKTKINYHGTNQVDHLHEIMSTFCEEVYVSLREDQENDFIASELKDKFVGLGPLGGILSAFMKDPNVGWLVVAADLPFVDEEVVKQLLQERDASKIATCFIKSGAEFPDPLCTIWEPKSYLHLLEFIALGYSCPRKVLINNDVKKIELKDHHVLMNVNDQVELEKAKNIIEQINN